MDGLMDGWMDGLMDGWMEGWYRISSITVVPNHRSFGTGPQRKNKYVILLPLY